MSKAFFIGVHQFGAAFVDHTGEIGDENIFNREAEVNNQIQTSQRSGARTRHHQLAVLKIFADHLHAIQDGCTHNDGGAVLIIVKDGDFHPVA